MTRLRETAVLYQASSSPKSPAAGGDIRAKLFANGRSQAVRLPKEFRLPGSEVLIRREGERVILEPIPEVKKDAKGWPVDHWNQLDALGQGEDFLDPEPLSAGLLAPDELDVARRKITK